jgi:hypothetical protein
MIIAASAAALLLAAPPQAAPQTSPGSDITNSLNSGPPRPAEYLAPPPAPVVEPGPAPVTSTAPAASPPAERPRPDEERFRFAEPFVAPAETQPPRIVPVPVTPAPSPRTAPITPPRSPIASTSAEPLAATPVEIPPATQPPASAPANIAVDVAPRETPTTGTTPPPPSTPAVTVLDAAARAALPFSVDLPAGFEIVTGRPGPDFKIYTIRRGDRSFAMVYAGPASQFPIYSGEMVEAGGRASVVSTEGGVRHAREHLFQRDGATPREIHVWTMSLDGADRALAERIAQSVDVR